MPGDKTGTEYGYNTADGYEEFGTKSQSEEKLLSAIPIEEVDGSYYREFQLDVNELSNDPDWFLSLDVFQIWLTDIEGGRITGYDLANWEFFNPSAARLVYSFGDVDNYSIKMDYQINSGSGWGDYRVLIPESMFLDAGYGPDTYVVLFTFHGEQWDISDGFEEWGAKVAQYASKSGYKWHDRDADGIWDTGEEGLPGWTIFVDLNGNGSLDAGEPSAVTGSDGYYQIQNIPQGTYRVYEVQQTGWHQSYPALGYYEETFLSGDALTDNNFGNWTTATKSGMKFEDLDADGVKD
ncbi:MAG: SdrD B-like domain-containing protein, partial [Bacillota bacterium]|nr:SdrD B-like domain-containing protein [Bacillota bacterium]